jgi:hypothetical protein
MWYSSERNQDFGKEDGDSVRSTVEVSLMSDQRERAFATRTGGTHYRKQLSTLGALALVRAWGSGLACFAWQRRTFEDQHPQLRVV